MLYIMRHGKTDWNEKRKLQGKTDIPLNETGRAMAREAQRACRGVHFDLCYSSPLIRARETAEIVLEGRELSILTDERLREMSFGIYEGVERALDVPGSPMHVLFQSPESYQAPEGAESLEDLYARTGDFLKEKIEPALKQGLDVLIVGHGAMNSSIICQIRKLPLNEFWSAGIEQCKLLRLL